MLTWPRTELRGQITHRPPRAGYGERGELMQGVRWLAGPRSGRQSVTLGDTRNGRSEGHFHSLM